MFFKLTMNCQQILQAARDTFKQKEEIYDRPGQTECKVAIIVTIMYYM